MNTVYIVGTLQEKPELIDDRYRVKISIKELDSKIIIDTYCSLVLGQRVEKYCNVDDRISIKGKLRISDNIWIEDIQISF